MTTKGIFLLASVCLLAGCATNNELVTRLTADSTGCDISAIEVTDLGQLYAGRPHYQTEGCGTTIEYECPTADNIVMASVGIFNLDPRRCVRVKR